MYKDLPETYDEFMDEDNAALKPQQLGTVLVVTDPDRAPRQVEAMRKTDGVWYLSKYWMEKIENDKRLEALKEKVQEARPIPEPRPGPAKTAADVSGQGLPDAPKPKRARRKKQETPEES